MYLLDIIFIMILMGICGSVVNYYSDGNKVNDTKEFKRSRKECLFLGIAATILVPFFLKLAESTLLSNIKIEHNKTYSILYSVDEINSSAENYLLWAAYCLLAAAAGMRFIDLLINKILTQAQVEKLQTESKNKEAKIDELEVKVQETEKVEEKRKVNLQISELEQTTNGNSNLSGNMKTALNVEESQIPILPPIIFANDPQKGRFGGKNHVGDRVLSVDYGTYPMPGFLNLKITVMSENENNPLKGNVYLYLHDSFAKSIIKLDADGKQQVSYEVPSYGAFTIGASTDYGKTLLELDIAELNNFPQDFRER